MAKTKPFSLSAMVDTDGEGDVSDDRAEPSTISNKENDGASIGARKKGGRPKATAKRFTKPKRLSNETSTPPAEASKKSKAGRKKAPLVEASHNHVARMDELDELAQSDSANVVNDNKKVRAGTKRKATEDPQGRAPKARDTKQVALRKNDGEFQYTPTQVKVKAVRAKAHEVPETQADADPTLSPPLSDQSENEETFDSGTVKAAAIGRAPSQQKQPPPMRRRGVSPFVVDQSTGDPALRRKLGEMTRKYDNICLKYRDLREIAVREAEANAQTWRKQADDHEKAAGDLIASLKKEIATHKAIVQETQGLRSELKSRESELMRSRSVADGLSKSLLDSQNENKVLQAKLSSSRGASVPIDRTPGSAMRSKSQAQPKTGSTSNADLAAAQLKHDLYSDLTGLILRDVDVGPDADTFDCIQTGRNGTLHFKLAVTKDPEESYEDVEFQYTPRLDSSRDRDLIELLPEYLTEEITFSRMNAAPFYARIMDTLMKKRVVEAG